MPLLERGPVQIELSRLLHEAATTGGRLVFLGGEAGIGKTSLVRRFAEVVGSRARVLQGACDPVSTPRPLGPLLDMRERLGGRYAALLARDTDRDALFRGFLASLDSPERPVLVLVEDVHWADEATLDLLRFLGRRLDRVRALLIATYRSDEVGNRHPLRVVLGDLATVPAVQRLALEPLSRSAVQALCAGTGLDASRLHEQTGGNPFFVTEVIASGGTGIPATVRDAVLARAARLPEGARAALDAAAVLGVRVEPALLEAMSGAGVETIDPLLAGGMLRAEGERLAFHHELAREAVLQTMPPHRKLALHRAALEVLRRLPGGIVEVDRLAYHAEGAGEREAVLEYAPRAARRARDLSSHREAAAQLARALRFADHLPALERAELLEAYAIESSTIDRFDEAIRASDELVTLWRSAGDRLREGGSLSVLAGRLVSHGRNAEAEEASRASIELLETLPPGLELARAYVTQAGLRMLNRDTAEAVEWAGRVLTLVGPDGDPGIRVSAYDRLGSARLVAGDSGGERFLMRALDLALEEGLHWEAARAYSNLGSAWGEWHEFLRAEPYLEEGIAYAAAHQYDVHQAYMLSWQALVRLYLGRWSDAEESARRVTERSSAISRIMARIALGRLKVRRGDSDAAYVLDEALELALPTQTLQRLAPVRAMRAEAAWLAGDLDRVRDEAGSALDLAMGHRHPWMAGELLFWLARAGAHVDTPAWIAPPFALQIAGAWEEAAAEWQRRGCPYEAAQARMESGGPESLRAALAEFERLGAAPHLRLARRRLLEAGVRGIPRGPRARTRDNPAQLTPRQVQIVHLLADGLQNSQIAQRLFLSPKTVGHHVSAALSKLGVRNRTEAVREATRLGILEDREPDGPR